MRQLDTFRFLFVLLRPQNFVVNDDLDHRGENTNVYENKRDDFGSLSRVLAMANFWILAMTVVRVVLDAQTLISEFAVVLWQRSNTIL